MVVRAGDGALAISRDYHGSDLSFVAFQNSNTGQLGALQIPDQHGLVERAGDGALAIARQCHGSDRKGMALQDTSRLVTLLIPDPYCIVVQRAGDGALAIGRDCHGSDPTCVALQKATSIHAYQTNQSSQKPAPTGVCLYLARWKKQRQRPKQRQNPGRSVTLQIPNPNSLVDRTGDSALAIRRQRHGHDRIRVALQYAGRPIALQIQDPQGMVARTGESALAVARQRYGIDQTSVAFQYAGRPVTLHIPDPKSMVPRTS